MWKHSRLTSWSEIESTVFGLQEIEISAGWPIYGLIIQSSLNLQHLFSQRLKLYYDHGEIKRYNGKRRVDDLKAFIDKFVVTSEVLDSLQLL